MSREATIRRIVERCDFATQIIPYDDKYRDDVVAGAMEMHDNSTFGDYSLDTDKLVQQLKAAQQYPDTLRFRLAILDGRAIGGMYGQISRMFFTDELMARDVGWWVRQEWRGSWAAICLLEDFEQWARARGCKKAFLGQSSAISIEVTRKLYENCGYRVIGVNTVKEL
jgi:hypothetical protein